MKTSLLRRPTVTTKTGLPETSLYRDMEAGLFPSQIRIGPNTVAWPEHEVDAVIAARIAGKSNDEIRALVKRLHAARAGFAELAMAVGEDRG